MHRFFHGLAHVGLVTVSVAATAGWLAPPPFNLIIVAAAAGTQGVLALKNHPKQ